VHPSAAAAAEDSASACARITVSVAGESLWFDLLAEHAIDAFT
jgi:hypothetical protein